MDKLLKQRSSMKAKLTNFDKYLKIVKSCDSLSILQQNELKCRLSRIEGLYEQFDTLQIDIEEQAEKIDDAFKEREQFESQYFSLISCARTILAGHEPAVSSATQLKDEHASLKGNSSIVRLPPIELPRFDGQQRSWLEFRDSFISLIDNNTNIDDINKLRYLQSALQGSPALLVLENLEICSENYKQAWQSLCSRYEKPRLLVNKHLESLFNLEPITKESCTGIRRLIDNTNTNLRALQTLKQPIGQWDRIIVFLLESKLDTSTSKDWEQYRGSNLGDFPTLAEFMKFLENKSDYLASLEESEHTKKDTHKQKSITFNTNTSINKNQPKNNYTKTKNIFKPKEKQCAMCNQDHNLYMCELFRSASIETRNAKVKDANLCSNCLRPGHTTQKCKCLTNCKYCNQRHNTLLHMETTGEQLVAMSANTIQKCTSSSHVLLSTALVKVFDCRGDAHTARILLDNGSTSNFITSDLCEKLGVLRRSESATVTGINEQSCISTQSCFVKIQSFSSSFKSDINCYILPKITNLLPSTYININNINLPTDIKLADPSFYMPSVIDILVGAEVFWNILGNNSINLGKNQPKLFETKLGWLISGEVQQYKQQPLVCNFLNTNIQKSELTRFWELDSISVESSLTQEQKACEENFRLTTKRNTDGCFIVAMPLKSSPSILGDSYQKAKVRFISLERKFKKEPEFRRSYIEFMQEYIQLGHMTENKSSNPTPQKCYFLPHHGVIREQSATTKLRVVFDASATTTSGVSLNDLQMVGPTVQEDLFSILVRFRQNRYVVSADVEKMYRCIILDESQRSLQQIIFRFNEHEPFRTYTLNTLTYGTASAPYIATKCLVSLGDTEDIPLSVQEAVKRDFYVDDYIGGGDSIENTIQICKGVSSLLASAKLNLRKWHSNNSQILQAITSNIEPSKSLNLDSSASSKTLGIYWLCSLDMLSFQINIQFLDKVTKRHILSVISQIFDPLGLIGPCIVEAKVLMQKLWIDKSSWDDKISQEILQLWQSFANTLPALNSLQIPRWVLCEGAQSVEIHTFTDASEVAYGACVYVRSVTKLGVYHVKLLTSKNKVAPIKTLTMPRLELCAALLGARLCAKIMKSLTLRIVSQHFWCDSTIVLGWLSTSQNQLPPFVRARVSEIQELTQDFAWRYVPSSDNPADLVSRGVKADQIGNASIWWNGPSFLQLPEIDWPKFPNPNIKTQTNCTTLLLNNNQNTSQSLQTFDNKSMNTISNLIHKKSVYKTLQRTIAYILRFIHNCAHPSNKKIGMLSIEELEMSTSHIISISQKEMFPDEYTIIKSGQTLPSKNRITAFSPFLDSSNIIRVGGRLSNSPYSYDVKHPILLHSKHHLTNIIFRMHHLNLLHAGPQLLLANIHQAYWVIGGRNLSKKTVKQCVKCCRFKAQIVQPVMGQLPAARTNLEFPFLHTGVDYAGPILIADRRGRGCKLLKAYICIFVCHAVKAVHLELVPDMTKEAYIAALNRFIARRGKPKIITSDNGTTFVGACNVIEKLVHECNIAHDITQLGIEFKFVPPYTPHFNGISEAAVRSTKGHLKKLLNLTHLTFEEMSTCLAQIESILNSRPLTPISSDPSDFTALTPSHFLIGRPLTSIPHPQIFDANINRLERYRRIELIKTHFWKRFSDEYVPLLQQKTKWKQSFDQLKENTLVLVKDNTSPPLLWLLGRITKVYPGSDKEIRVADIKTKKGTLRRAFNNICPLPQN